MAYTSQVTWPTLHNWHGLHFTSDMAYTSQLTWPTLHKWHILHFTSDTSSISQVTWPTLHEWHGLHFTSDMASTSQVTWRPLHKWHGLHFTSGSRRSDISVSTWCIRVWCDFEILLEGCIQLCRSHSEHSITFYNYDTDLLTTHLNSYLESLVPEQQLVACLVQLQKNIALIIINYIIVKSLFH